MKTCIVYLSVPENFKNQFNNSKEAFPINPDIPIPAEIPDTGEKSLEGLSMEMIVRGMLRVIEEREVDQKWIDYYAGFVLFLRPDILEICQKKMEEDSREDADAEH